MLRTSIALFLLVFAAAPATAQYAQLQRGRSIESHRQMLEGDRPHQDFQRQEQQHPDFQRHDFQRQEMQHRQNYFSIDGEAVRHNEPRNAATSAAASAHNAMARAAAPQEKPRIDPYTGQELVPVSQIRASEEASNFHPAMPSFAPMASDSGFSRMFDRQDSQMANSSAAASSNQANEQAQINTWNMQTRMNANTSYMSRYNGNH